MNKSVYFDSSAVSTSLFSLSLPRKKKASALDYSLENLLVPIVVPYQSQTMGNNDCFFQDLPNKNCHSGFVSSNC